MRLGGKHKVLKFNLMLFAALCAASFAFATKITALGINKITACFEQVSLQNSAGDVFYTTFPNARCQDIASAILTKNSTYLRLNPLAGDNVKRYCAEDYPVYCCIEFQIDGNAPPTVPRTSPGGAPEGKYRIINILCRWDQ